MSTLQLRKLLVYAMNLIAFGTLHLSGAQSPSDSRIAEFSPSLYRYCHF